MIFGTQGEDFIAVGSGSDSRHAAALMADGTIWGWGLSIYGSVGDNTLTDRSSPVSVKGYRFKGLSCGSNVTHGLDDYGYVWGWGYNGYGTLGDYTRTNKSSPTAVMGGVDVDVNKLSKRIGENVTSFLDTDGYAWSFGRNDYTAQLGDNTLDNRSSPVSVVGGHVFTKLEVGNRHTSGLKADGSIWGWGRNDNYELTGVDGWEYNISSPISTVGGHSFIDLSSGAFQSLALKADGSAWAWGYNDNGQLGDNSTTERSSPVSVVGGYSFTKISSGQQHVVALQADGSAWSWGLNEDGQLGDNSITQKSSPVSVVGGLSYTDIAAGYNNNLALCGDGSVWTWGYNEYGQLGDNSTTNRSSPVSVVGGYSFIKISCSEGMGAALKADGSIWMWGNNQFGQLGDNSRTSKSSPVSVTGGRSYIAVQSGRFHTFGVQSSSAVWAWGGNTYGELGTNTLTSYSNPYPIFTLYGKVKKVDSNSHTLALRKRDGSAWGWGYNIYGGIGTYDRTSYSQPTSVAGGHSFLDICCGTNYTLAIRGSDEALLAWGQNTWGQLGDNSVVSFSSPMLVAGVRASSIFVGGASSAFIDFNGRTFVWGGNAYGELGNNTLTSYSFPQYNTIVPYATYNFSKRGLSGNVSVGLRDADGTLWSSGRNDYGQLGDNSRTSRSSPVSVVGGYSFVDISVGVWHTTALKADGSVWTWGRNDYGQLGDNSRTSRSSPVSVVGGYSFTKVSGGEFFSLALQVDGTAWAWGINEYGQLGDNSRTSRSSPVSVVGGYSFANITAGAYQSTTIKSDGTVWAWGCNGSGQIGDGTTTSRSSPVSVVGGYSFISVVNGIYHSLALKADGSVWSWGWNYHGQLGDGTTTDRLSPVSVIGGYSFISINAGGMISTLTLYSTAVQADGTMWTWGGNDFGQLGDNSRTSRSSPVSVFRTGNIGKWKKVVAGAAHTLAVRDDSTVWAWGLGTSGQVGAGLNTSISYPTIICGMRANTNVKPSGSVAHSLVLSSDGTVWAWGANTFGQLGDNSRTSRSFPVSIVGMYSFTKIDNREQFSLALKADGTVWSWGDNASGQLGDNTRTSRSSPVSVVGGYSFINIGAGSTISLALKADGSAWSWGSNLYGQLGDNSTTSRSSPVSVVGGYSFANIMCGDYHSLALKADGTVWSWGNNLSGQLGDNTRTSRSSPVSVVGGYSFINIICGAYHSIALKADGTVWSWGYNDYGQLGDNTRTSRSSPVSVVGGYSFADISAGSYHSLALKADGTVWSWGSNLSGQLGDNSTTSRSSPVSVVGGYSFINISHGGYNPLALKADGSVWTWGDNGYGQLGDNSITQKSSPILVPQFGSFTKIGAGAAHSGAIRQSDGSAWCWGANHSGQLGTNNLLSYNVMTSVVGGHSFIDIDCSGDQSYGLKSDGSVWAWGSNTDWQLGNVASTQNPRTPMSVSCPESFIDITGSNYSSFGIKGSDGSAWSWGYNLYGNLGNNSREDVLFPVSVVGGYSFSKIAGNANHCLALQSGGVWAWGVNTYGQLGDNTRTTKSSPVYVFGGLNITITSVAIENSTLFLASDGSAWAAGVNTYGQLGDNTRTTRSSPASVVGGYSFAAIEGGFSGHALAILGSDGSAWAWGRNDYGQLGNNTRTSYSSPVSVVGGISFTFINAGYTTTAGIRGSDGSAWMWGENAFGQLGDNSTTSRSSPVSVVGGYSFIKIKLANMVSAALKADGTVWTWGRNNSGHLGDNSRTDRSSPVSVVGGYSFVDLSVSDISMAAIRGSDGTAWSWGSNLNGQLGTNNATSYSSPVSVVGGYSFKEMGQGGYYWHGALKADGSAWAWGGNAYGQLGDNSRTDRSSPVSAIGGYSYSKFFNGQSTAFGIAGGYVFGWGSGNSYIFGDMVGTSYSIPVIVRPFAGSFTDIAGLNASTSIVLRSDGSAWGWGANDTGQIGNNLTTSVSIPVSVVGGYSFKNVFGGLSSSYGIRGSDGTVWGWGYNNYGQLGVNDRTNRSSPVSVLVPTSFKRVVSATGYGTALCLNDNGTLWTTGAGAQGILGDGYTASRSSPIMVTGLGTLEIKKLGDGALAINTSDGTVWSWGNNTFGQLGDNTTTSRSLPVSVVGGYSFINIAGGIYHTIALKADGSVWDWGYNGSGQLGDNSTTDRSSPVSVVGGYSFTSINIGNYFSIALKTDGSAWAWGDNTYGQLGDNTTTNRSSPVSVVGGYSFTSISGGRYHVIALQIDGTVWAWGENTYGQLGDNSRTSRSSPVSVVGGYSFTSIDSGREHNTAIQTNGSAWAWGNNTYGQLGDNSTTSRSSPVSVVGGYSFTKTSCCEAGIVALKTDGSIWTCGRNNYGQLGDNTRTDRSSPVSVVGGYSFVNIDSGRYHILAQPADGSVWAWGNNDSGQLGNNTRTSYSSPVLLPALIGKIIDIDAGWAHAAALRSDGTAWCWGYNNYGQIGDNTAMTTRYTPTSVIGGHSFKKIRCNTYSTFASKEDGTVWTWGYGAYGVLGRASYTSSPVIILKLPG